MSKRTIWLAGLCLAALAAAAPASESQRVSSNRNAADPTRFDKSIKLYQDGMRHYQQGNSKLAAQELDDFLAQVGEHAGGNFVMGLVQIDLNELQKARTYMANAVKFDAQMAAPRGYLGALEIVLGNAAAAMEQKTALDAMKATCAGTCPKAKEIDEAIQRIVDNAAAAQQPAAPAAPAPG